MEKIKKYIPKLNIDFFIFIFLCLFAIAIPENSNSDGILFFILILWIIKLSTSKIYWQKNLLSFSLILVIITFLISFIFNIDKYATSLLKTSLDGFQKYYLAIIAPLLLFLIVSSIPLSEDKVNKILQVFLFAMSIFIIYHLVVYFAIPTTDRFTIFGINPNRCGALIAMLSIMLIVLISFEKNKRMVYLYSIFLLSALVGLFFTSSRGAWIGFTASILFLTFFILKNRIIQLLTLIIGILSISVFCFIPALMTRFLSIFSISATTNYQRLHIWKLSLTKMVFISPIFGIGPGLYRTFFIRLNQHPDNIVNSFPHGMPHAHNNFLHVLVENGMFGLIAFIFMFISLFLIAFKIKKEASTPIQQSLSVVLIGWLVYWTTHGLIDYTFGIRQVMYSIFLIFALLLSNQKYNLLHGE